MFNHVKKKRKGAHEQGVEQVPRAESLQKLLLTVNKKYFTWQVDENVKYEISTEQKDEFGM